jgi:hypothetical protein
MHRLQDVVHSEKRIYLVFEYLDLDLKKYMDSCPELAKNPRLIKVRFTLSHFLLLIVLSACLCEFSVANSATCFLKALFCVADKTCCFSYGI